MSKKPIPIRKRRDRKDGVAIPYRSNYELKVVQYIVVDEGESKGFLLEKRETMLGVDNQDEGAYAPWLDERLGQCVRDILTHMRSIIIKQKPL